MTSQTKAAHRLFVRQFIDEKLLEQRLSVYPAIKRAFDLDTLKGGFNKPPYYCHYMAWRLGTWESETMFARLEELFCLAELLPNWEHERPLLTSNDFADFWSLVWQLQVAEYLNTIGEKVRWAKSGPDLSVLVDGEQWFVECYTYHKSFGLLLFLDALLKRIDPALHAEYDLCKPCSLPNNMEREEFLKTVFKPFHNPTYLVKAKSAAKKRYPEVLYKHPDSSLSVYVDGEDSDAYTPGIIPNRVGIPEDYLNIALKEAAKAKQDSNSLAKCRPNLVAVNYLLSMDYQLATNLRGIASRSLDLKVSSNIDALAVSAVGIDEHLTKHALTVVHGTHSGLHKFGELANS
jgi:hypothetical protein